MKKLAMVAILATFMAPLAASPAAADPGRHDRPRGHHNHHGHYERPYGWWWSNSPRPAYYPAYPAPTVYYRPAPVYAYPAPRPVYVAPAPAAMFSFSFSD